MSAQGLVEFALIGPVFLAFLIGFIDLGRAVWVNHELTNGTREVSRYVMVRGTADTYPGSGTLEPYFLTKTRGIGGADLTVTPSGAPGQRGQFITITSTYTYRPIVSMILGRGTIQMRQQSRVVIQS